MKKQEFNQYDSNEKSVKIRLIEPENIFLPIPNPTKETQTAIQILAEINNSQSSDTLLELQPEMISEEGLLMPLFNLKNERFPSQNKRAKVSERVRCYMRAKLAWYDQQLQLEFSHDPSINFDPPITIWKFVGLTAGVYKLRFAYCHPNESNTKQPTTQSINLHLLEPIETSSSAVNADGIVFETIPPQPVVEFPSQPIIKFPYSGKTDFQFGIKITNLTAPPVRFALQSFLPEFLAPEVGLLVVGVNRNGLRAADELDLPVVRPGETVELLLKATISSEGTIGGREGYGGVWFLYERVAKPLYKFQPGIYYLKLKYKNIKTNMEQELKLLTKNKKYITVNDFWTGSVTTPFVKLVLH